VPSVTQVPLQATCPEGHGLTHCPALHIWSAEQACPQAPQFWESPARSVQLPPQQPMSGPAGQASPQAPQLLTSDVTSRQLPEQQDWVPLQPGPAPHWHIPVEWSQVSPGPQPGVQVLTH
jgi:hypothetical protein